ncbi:TetR/AcrR family transcriptional regulator [soil metagenome]
MIIDAVIPLLLEHGKDVTSRQIAEAAGIAEGTIFRAFGDKESLITAAVTSFMEGRHRELEPSIDSQLSLEEKLRELVEGSRHRVRDVMRMAALMGRPPVAPDTRRPRDAQRMWSEAQRLRFNASIAAIFDGDRAALRISPEELGDYVRMIAIASTIPLGREFTVDEVVDLIMHGITTTQKKD